MSGLYIHIPFCSSRCVYCGFFSSTAKDLKAAYVEAACEELRIRKDYLKAPVETIYLGGGTPSLLSQKEMDSIFNAIYKYNKVEDASMTEITIECNPDDITPQLAHYIRSAGVNRVSMGAQSFSDEILRFAKRRHNSVQIPKAVECLRNEGISNISIDLMFGFPNESTSQWDRDIDSAIKLGVEHLSAYSLMYEEGTPLYRLLQEGKVKECDDDTYLCMYNTLIDKLETAGYEHYEISNFAKKGFRSRHNSSYWKGIPYCGIGAAAHSFNGHSRQWNISDIKGYIRSIGEGIVPAETEVLSTDSMFDDTVMTRLRTREGIDLALIEKSFGKEYLEYIMKEAKKHIDNGLLELYGNGKRLRLTRQGLFLSDSVMADLMHV